MKYLHDMRIDHGAALTRVLELSVLVDEDMDRGLKPLGLSRARTRLLWELQQQGPSTQRVLAQTLDVSPRNITGLVDGLVESGFVTREPHPSDRRATLVTFTRRGSRVMAQMEQDYAQFADLLFGDLTDRQVNSLVKSLDLVLTRLREALDAPKGTR